MKLNKIQSLLFGLGLLLTTQSCNKYLDKEPDNRTEINTIDKVAQLVTTAYPRNDYYYFTESYSDNTEDKGSGVGSLDDVIARPYNWQDLIGDQTGSTTSYWNGCYEGIAAANQALEAIEKNNLGTGVLPYKGEALLARAYAHFMLVTFFSKPYVIGGANNSPGIPYVTAPETKVIVQYDRETVAATYAKIEKDLTEGIALLSSSAYSVPKYHFTPAAAHAFASRFYLFKGEWQKVIDHSTATVPANDFYNNLRPLNTIYRAYGAEDFRSAFTRSDQKSSLLLTEQYSLWQRQTSPRYGYGINLVKMFSTAGNFTGKTRADKILSYGAPNYTTYKFKEYFFRTSPGADIGYPYLIAPLLTVDESLMNRAEAYAELGQFDNSLRDVNIFLSTKITNYSASTDVATLPKITVFYNIADSKEAIIKLILESKKAEFLQEGIRWLDIVRKGLTVTHNQYDTFGVETFKDLAPNDLRRVFQIPQEALLSGVPLNPR
ncbi:RagB/SusD family nutrient uptake outer membrane protein [Pedobacter frigidisoli]|uniref:RagB/SusD family nutrient uptake outer membrane protein n=1 Tax=Pedobacter frigidisoli TaxID=2530455 RepID=A0A4V2MNE7_9SPHI|nr:RagB/SusD family nutrient uptake outer membrane protein [Pedobacter frigidisoli]TCD12516.1 RagB/SusD family nutrient uptake outer membrane protein [Pedobacter frigidisoli]